MGRVMRGLRGFLLGDEALRAEHIRPPDPSFDLGIYLPGGNLLRGLLQTLGEYAGTIFQSIRWISLFYYFLVPVFFAFWIFDLGETHQHISKDDAGASIWLILSVGGCLAAIYIFRDSYLLNAQRDLNRQNPLSMALSGAGFIIGWTMVVALQLEVGPLYSGLRSPDEFRLVEGRLVSVPYVIDWLIGGGLVVVGVLGLWQPWRKSQLWAQVILRFYLGTMVFSWLGALVLLVQSIVVAVPKQWGAEQQLPAALSLAVHLAVFIWGLSGASHFLPGLRKELPLE